ncbi:hypothetical protein CC80DRAFT_543953 [Byssothecium circinans]|uniref:Uncharacterized protein n=1 Tax=Byssothecium circinans TaxID=147558 RepID=A0A6A5UHG0_9PLEO|nr:hypothetical protein CC80DRAFT_543953 [Byssothecium circinans]
MPSDLPKWIQPTQGMPTAVPSEKMLAQVAFKYALNYEFVREANSGNQIFELLPSAIADALGINKGDVVPYGLKAADTTQFKGWITTLAIVMIPRVFNDTLATNITQAASAFYHNKDDTVRALTDLVDPTWPLEFGKYPDMGDSTKIGNPSSQPSDNPGQQGAGPLGSGMGGSHKVNPTSAGIATGAVLGACAYGAAMFFVARRYRQKKLSHKRSSSVPSSSRFTYGSVGGGAWMSGARNGRLTPGGIPSRGSRGSDSSNGRSVRTQQISAPVMAENSLGWN